MERLVLDTADGVSLEAELSVPDGASVCCVLAHPHPLYGGSMRGGIPDVLSRSLPASGVGALRFNFRGVEGSGGTHGGGVDERFDVAAAIEAVPSGLAVVLCGYSFGGDVSLCVDDARVVAWCAVAPPLAVVPVADMVAPADARPKHLLVAEHDQYNPPVRARELTSSWTSTTLELIEMADHFFGGAMGPVADAVRRFATGLAP